MVSVRTVSFRATPKSRAEIYEDGRGFLKALGVRPFSPEDLTAGSETEMQAIVSGSADRVDLPLTIRDSGFFRNLIRRSDAGETPRHVIAGILGYLEDNPRAVWENSWVRFAARELGDFARRQLESDLRRDKDVPGSPARSDRARFFSIERGEELARLPVSYLLRLSLAEAGEPLLHSAPGLAPSLADMMLCFSSDNTSPETVSLYVARPGFGRPRAPEQCAGETAQRLLLSNLLAAFANERFGLAGRGQRVSVYLSPNPPIRQKILNNFIPDAFYRDLFMSPCLEWTRGEEKQAYMHLCHQVLSRSSLNATAKLRDAGLVTRNLVVVPNISNVSLANNGTHVSLGSTGLGALLKAETADFGETHEKCLGDLAIKILEHFLPLFPVNYSAAPHRLDFSEFHPEQALGFLPHELAFDHLRMIWRRWRKKARIRCFGQPLTPFGPEWLDRKVSAALGLKGDLVPDFRLADHPVCLLSTENSPALDGTLENDLRLKRDLEQQGVFDSRMALYIACRLRRFHEMGFTGFEARFFSLFRSLLEDMRPAVELQSLVTALAFHYILSGRISHAEIPDSPYLESERRQIFFAVALGIPTFYVRRDTRNYFLLKILRSTEQTRTSRRYPNYLRVPIAEYQKALLRTIREDGRDLIEDWGFQDTVRDLERRLRGETTAAALVRDILEHLGVRSPYSVSAAEFNQGAEDFYRTSLRKCHLNEGLDDLEQEVDHWHRLTANSSPAHSLLPVLAAARSERLIRRLRFGLASECLSRDDQMAAIRLFVVLQGLRGAYAVG